MPMPPRNDKTPHTPHGEAQQHALVLAAFDLIAEGGFERLRTREVAARAGVNIATLHYYFTTKEDLIRGVVAYLQSEFAAQNPLDGPSTAAGPREELHQDFADLRYRVQTTPTIYLVLFELLLRSFRDPAIKTILREMDTQWRQYIATYLSAGILQGIFRADADVPTLTVALVAFIKGSVMQMLLTPETFPAEQIFALIERWLTEHAT